MKTVWITSTRSSDYVVVEASTGKAIPNVLVVIPELDDESVAILRITGYASEAERIEREMNSAREDKPWSG